MQYNMADLFESVVDVVADREALIVGDRRLTYGELEARANRLAHHLSDNGIGAGDHVGVHMMNGSEYLETMLACFKIRAVPVNVNYRYVTHELRYLYDDADLVGLVFDAEFADRVAAVAPDVPALRHLLVVGSGGADALPTAIPYEDALAGASPERDFAPRSSDDLFLLYTGGTTGMPKGVMWRHEDLFFAGMGGGAPMGEPVAAPEELAPRVADGSAITMMAAAPLMHGAAELASFIAFFAGNRLVLIRRYSGPGVLELIEREGVNTISIVGDAMALPLIEALEAGDRAYDVSSLFVLSTAGAIMSGSVRAKLQELLPNIFIIDSYGSSETGFNGSATEDSSPEQGLKFRVNERTGVIADDMTVVALGSDTIGRVAQRGNVPLGYYNAPDKTAETFVEIDGERWVLTGDSATVDAEGVIHFLGRGSVCINSGGEKIYPEEVEAALKSHPDIVDAVVAGIPDERWGERVAALLQVTPGADAPTLADIEEHLADRIARYKIPRVVQIVDAVERSPSGKPDYRWARETAAASAAR